MIKVTRQNCGSVRSIGMTGHAGYAEEGKDIVCAAASILLFTLIEHLERTGIPYSSYAEKGSAGVAVTDPDRKANEVFDVIETGYILLAEKYPEHVELA